AVESGVNASIREPMDAVWWGISTLVGGQTDVTAVTTEGRIATVALLLIGAAMVVGATVRGGGLSPDPEVPPAAHGSGEAAR
ncbi:MAG TPA: hypothetical protein VFP56_03645, partial [Candidatus Limnocylindrales bacterium]|nr:hypothetical protein [Candidatus Limnocylindrales bacterium]